MAVDHVIDLGLELPLEDENDTILPRVVAHVAANPIAGIRRGDTISVVPAADRYRNDGTFMWTGTEVIDLDREIDSYGATPLPITDMEFSPTYWISVIAHNRIIRFSDSIQRRIIDSLSDEGVGSVTLNGVTWPVRVEGDRRLDVEEWDYCELEDIDTEPGYEIVIYPVS